MCRSRCRDTGAPGKPGRAPFGKFLRGNQQRRNHAGGDKEDTHDDGCKDEQLAGIADAVFEFFPFDQRHDRHAYFKTGEPER